MKIKGLKTYILPNPGRSYVFVKVMTDEGIHGWGEGTLESQETSVVSAIEHLSGYIIDRDPTRVEFLWQSMRRHGFWRGGVVINSAMSAIEQALWDITGKAFGQPVYRLLGGACRDRIRCYCHGAAPHVREIMGRGWKAIKTGAGGYGKDGRFHEETVIADTVANIAGMREAGGDSLAILVDCHGRFRPALALRLIRALEPYRLFFLEEPVPPDNVEAYRRISECGSPMDIATGERLFTRWGFRTLIEEQYVDVIQPDVTHCGGISELRKIAAMAEIYHIQVAPHNPNGPLCTAASVHVAASLPNFNILEYHDSGPLRDEIQVGPAMKPVEGYIELPTRPGLGVELDEERLKRAPAFKPSNYSSLLDGDGAPADV
ncbi:MAG: galactonate dehydratase [Planctomycetes bacterium]|nr:galactonate dehydratase [Planctomycetota bacterium]